MGSEDFLERFDGHPGVDPRRDIGVRIDRETGLLTNRADGSTTEEFFKEGTEPTRYASQISDGNQVYGGDDATTDGPVSTDDIF